MKKVIVGLVVLMVILVGEVRASEVNRLGIRGTSDSNELYDTVTNQSVLLRGSTYQRLKEYTWPSDGHKYTYHSNFSAGDYDRNRAAAAMDLMKTAGYNSVRVFTSQYQTGNQNGGQGLQSNYFDNLADFISLASQRGMYVNVVVSLLPTTGGYIPTANDTNIEDVEYQRYFLINSFVEAKARYLKEIAMAIKNRGAPMQAILWTIENEPYFRNDQKPFSLTSGKIMAANGQSYDMAVASDKDRMVEDSLIYFADTVRSSIRTVDANALVGITFFPPRATVFNPNWKILTGKLINQSTLDFVGVNSYPDPAIDMSIDIDSLQIGQSKKVLLMTEYGAYPDRYKTLDEGAVAMVNFQVLTCSKYHFRGWYYYDWDTVDSEYGEGFHIYHAIEDNGKISSVLAPNKRWNPCVVADSAPPKPVSNGSLDMANCSTFSGWAGNVRENKAMEVDLYADGVGVEHFVGRVAANSVTTEAVCQTLGINETTCKHGFVLSVPNSLKDGKAHTIDAYIVNYDTNPKLPNSGKIITCNPVVPTAIPTIGVQVGDANGDGKTDLLDFSMWKQEYSGNVTTKRADFNKDNKVDLLDFSMWKREYSK